MPLLWLAAASLSTYHQLGDRLTLFAFVPSLWLLLFIDANSIAFPQALLAGTPAIAVAGLILLKLKLPPRAAIISASFRSAPMCAANMPAIRNGRIFSPPNPAKTRKEEKSWQELKVDKTLKKDIIEHLN